MPERKTITVSPNVLRAFMEQLLCSVGCEQSSARTAAEIFLEADMRGVGLQGLDHMHTMIRGIQNGHADPKGIPSIAKESAASALIDGARGPGQVAALLAVDVAVAKGRKAGTCSVGIVNSSDIFMLGYYAERIARAGLIGFVFTGSPPQVHPFGGPRPGLGDESSCDLVSHRRRRSCADRHGDERFVCVSNPPSIVFRGGDSGWDWCGRKRHANQ